VLGQHRSTQRRIPTWPDDEERLTADIVELARQYGRYGYRKIAELLRTTAGWVVNDKRVERIWRREGLKVPAKQPKRSRLWLADGLCLRLRAERPNHVWSYDFVEDRTHEGRKYRMLNIIDEFTHECLAIRIDRKLKSVDVIDVLSDLFILRGVPERLRSDNGPEFVGRPCKTGSRLSERRRLISRPAAPGRTASSRASTLGSGTSCWMGRFSISSRRPGSWSKAGGAITTPNARTRHWATSLQRLKCSSPRSPRGRPRNPGQLRRPR
jgi:hypothetical protein